MDMRVVLGAMVYSVRFFALYRNVFLCMYLKFEKGTH